MECMLNEGTHICHSESSSIPGMESWPFQLPVIVLVALSSSSGSCSSSSRLLVVVVAVVAEL